MDIAWQYAKYATNLDYNDLPEEVILHVKKAILDIMGNDIGGYEWMESGPSIVDGLRKNTKFPPPVIVRDKLKNLYLLGGNTRLMLGTAMGYNLPVKIVDFKKEIQWVGKRY